MMVVSLLSSSPKNGVEIMDGIETMTRGWWRPTPGSIYPLLTRMSEEGTVRKRENDGRYELTAKARKEIDVSFGPRFRRPRTTDEIVTEMEGFVSYIEDLDKARNQELKPHLEKLKGLAHRLSHLAGEEETS
jgi:DNA-binding PadR family transcriptional regulator